MGIFSVVFVLLTLLSARPIQAVGCCSDGKYLTSTGTCSDPQDNLEYGTVCGSDQTCDITKDQCVNKATAVTTTSGTDPICPPGYTVPPDTWPAGKCEGIVQGRCCKEGFPGLGYCEELSWVGSCEDFKNIHRWADKTWCSDFTTIYDSSKKTCIKVAQNAWGLNTTTCQGTTGINTAIGCIPTGDPAKFLTFLFKWALGASSGIIVIMLILTGYNVLTSSGDPEKLKAAKENMVSIFEGFILIVFSLVLLQAVGASVLQLPTF